MLSDDGPWTIIIFVIIASLFVLSWIWLCPRISNSADDDASASDAQRQQRLPAYPRGAWNHQAATLPPPAARRRPPLLVNPPSALDGQRRLPQAITTAYLPAFAYTKSAVNSKVTAGTGDEEAAATCPVCLGAFEFGEMVRLLPLCLHLFHVECIDMWLAAHSTCPICRSGIDPTQMMDVDDQLPPI